jgi:hypothetical protein
MGRVVPHNLNQSLLTRLLDLERSGGYQVDQQARMNLRLIPQYGGTVGGVRRAALQDVGTGTRTRWRGYRLTYRLILRGWEVVYQNRSECYEEVPENWPTRIRQIQRWTRGHNQALKQYLFKLLRFPRHLGIAQVIDGALLLGVFAVAPILIVGWGFATALFFMGYPVNASLLALFAVATYSTLGNFAAFFEVATAARLDGSRNRIRLLPFLSLGFLVNLLAISRATVSRRSWMQPSAKGCLGQDRALSGQRRQRGEWRMTSLLGALGLLLVTIGWAALSLIPAFRELLRPTDVEPLIMVGRDNADIGRFARHFREWVSATMTEADGRLLYVPASGDPEPLRSLPPSSRDQVVVLQGPAELAGVENFAQELWAKAEFAGGQGATYRAILGERSVSLGPRSLVLRWLHSVGVLTVGDGSHLYGRTSSEREIHLGRSIGFDRLGAPAIVVGSGAPAAKPPMPEGLTTLELGDPHDSRLTTHDFSAGLPPRRSRSFDADTEVPAGFLIEGNLVVSGDLRLGPGTRVTGSVKTHGTLELAQGVVIEGSCARGDLTVAPRWVRGPISEAASTSPAA